MAKIGMVVLNILVYSLRTDLIPLTRAGEGDLLRLGVEAELDGGLEARGVRDNLVANTDLNFSVV